MVMDPELFTRAKSKSHGGVAALPKQALEAGHFPDWEAVDGPLPEAPKSAVVFPKLVDDPKPEPVEDEPATEPEPEQQAPAAPDKPADKPSARK